MACETPAALATSRLVGRDPAGRPDIAARAARTPERAATGADSGLSGLVTGPPGRLVGGRGVDPRTCHMVRMTSEVIRNT
ncbi:hypothetical protein GCM10010289_24550 [Streptomyces violascens]|uniref:Uncharacterized protein n=1 Tax=Streptomyces violascens TaxID=67381 RepID=A0ABQ3QI91_9ACTN|nr:hypothetical protein GCM10010289_24550 [Streptomyces violascens]GHI37018.1 hypothetical protein Sviol_14260 [Streptomyces violascens]